MQTSIGQGDTLVTPMEMALIASAVANDGEMIKPRYVDNIVSADGQAVKTFYKESLGTVMSGERSQYADRADERRCPERNCSFTFGSAVQYRR